MTLQALQQVVVFAYSSNTNRAIKIIRSYMSVKVINVS